MHSNRFLVIALACVILFATWGARAGTLAIEGVRFGFGGGNTRIVLDFNGAADFRAFLLDNPRRLVVDIPPVKWKTAQHGRAGGGQVDTYRSGVFDKDGLTRLVFDLTQPVVVEGAFTLAATKMSQDRVVIDLRPSSQNLFTAALSRVWGNRNIRGAPGMAPPPAVPVTSAVPLTGSAAVPLPPNPAHRTGATTARSTKTRYVIAIDAGHGGQDPGAISGSVREKDLTLQMAKELRRTLEGTGRYSVVLTRDGDRYVKLRDRVAIARKVNADLFISLHADKLPGQRDVRGASVYTLSQTASDAETAALAEGENNSGYVAGVDLKGISQDVTDILLDLAMREKMNESQVFAQAAVQALRRKNIRLLPNSHRSADFAVLKAPDVPAILVETGFLSNTAEARLLSSGAFQRSMAEALVDGIDAYFRKMRALNRVE